MGPMTVGIGLDIGGTKTQGVVVDDDGVIRASIRRPTALGADGVIGTAVHPLDHPVAAVGAALLGRPAVRVR